MKKALQKVISVILVLTIVLSVISIGVFAANSKLPADSEFNFDKDIPIVEVFGFGESVYTGLDTATEEDDVDVFGSIGGKIGGLLAKHLFTILFGMLLGCDEPTSNALTEVMGSIFGDLACDSNGVIAPGTGIKTLSSEIVKKNEYGYDNVYVFYYDWRLDMHSISDLLHEYILDVKKTTGSDQVALVGFSMGTCVLTTYLYEHYYTKPEERKNIHSVMYLSGAVNGVACCEDPFSANINFSSESLIRMIKDLMGSNPDLAALYTFIELLYSFGMFDPLVDFSNYYVKTSLNEVARKPILASIGTIPSFYAMMDEEHYDTVISNIFNTPEIREEYKELLKKTDYYQKTVKPELNNIIDMLMEDGKHFAIFSAYGKTMIPPVTSDNDRLSDKTITTEKTSFGATCASYGTTLGDDYIQAKTCSCNKNHISPDRQIDASTCSYPDVTWFIKDIGHTSDPVYFSRLVDTVTYSEEPITVWTYAELPQYLINIDDTGVVPMTKENAGEVVPFYETTLIGSLKKMIFG